MKLFSVFLLVTLFTFGSAPRAQADENHHANPATAWGEPGDPAQAARTIEIAMDDTMRFNPARISVKHGETVRFALKNEGQLKHEVVLGTIHELQKHAALMRKFPEMKHAEPNQASVEPGQTGTLIWRFTKTGTFDFACLQPGHYEVGMTGQVHVISTAATAIVSADMTEGEVRKVDKAAKKITLKHGDIKSLDMPGMTMVFQVKDPAMLDTVKAGDRVKFRAQRLDSALVITEIHPL